MKGVSRWGYTLFAFCLLHFHAGWPGIAFGNRGPAGGLCGLRPAKEKRED
jgi:hypothetical protein